MKIKRIISSFLAVLMLMSAFTIAMSAEEATEETKYEYKTSNAKPTLNYTTGNAVSDKPNDKGVYEEIPTQKVVTSAETKLATMDLRFEKDGYQLYVDAYSGEVATRCIATGEILFSNPYTVGESTATENSIKPQLLSQLVVKYVDVASGDDNTYYSYEWAASRGQIVTKNIKNGIRVEYTIGREEARMLVPRQIEKTAFETKILNVMEEASKNDSKAAFEYKKFVAYYQLYDLSAEPSETLRAEMEKAFPITKKMAVYVIDSSTSSMELATIEGYIKTYCPDYTYEELDEDHMLTEYESDDKNPPLFKMALEYTLDEQGVTVRLPANGIRFNEALYQLYSIEILPYMGTGAKSNSETSFAYTNSGYTFFPDGSGTLFDFEKITDLGASTTVTGKVYGQDYAYHTISGTHQEIIRYPVFGVVESENLTAFENAAAASVKKNNTSTETEENETETDTDTAPDKYKTRGFVAIVEEGDALMELSSYHAVRTSEYNTVRMIVYPRPQDTYNVADSISVGQNDTWTVVSSRKYTGNYKIRYIMLTDDAVAAEKGIEDYYECSYVGMAKAYREYLESNGSLTRLTSDDVKDDIPLYIETFGALETTERFLSIPLSVMTPLTTFDNVKTMYEELSSKGIENVNFILTGYTKGGISDPQIPYHLKWDGAVVDDMDFEDLVEYAKEEGFGVYPDFDFAYVQGNGMFDGLSLKKHAVKTIDDRYSSKREYSATKQTYISYYDLAVSPAYFSHFYEKLTSKYLKYDPIGISVSTLGNSLNSDFDEDEPYNREDSKEFTVKAFEYLAENYDKVMTSGGNAYTWKYVDYITDIALDSSRYSQSSASVPFLGIVLHGYVEFAGTPVNMEGNIEYALLKAIENGASLKFILSYQNTNNLKNYETLSQYYSVRYDIWFDDLVDLYNEVNTALAGVQTSLITDHKFLSGTRVPDDDELINGAKEAVDAALAGDAEAKDKFAQEEMDAYRNATLEIERIYEKYNDFVSGELGTSIENYNNILTNFRGNGVSVSVYHCDICDNDVTLTPEGKCSTPGCAGEPTTLVNKAIPEYTANLIALIAAAVDEDGIAALDEALGTYLSDYEKLVRRANTYLNEYVEFAQEIALANGKYKDLIEARYAEGKLPEAQYNELISKINAIDVNIVYTNNNITAFVDSIKAEIEGIRANLNTYVTDLTAEGGLLENNTSKHAVITDEYSYEIKVEESESNSDVKIETPTYESDDNKIVYVTYENGTAFLLNFNNYKVNVAVEDGNGNKTYYTLGAYGYIILKRGN